MNNHKTSSKGHELLRKAVFVFLGVGVVAAGYYVYDLRFPNHFVGDMYGLEVMCRLAVLVAVVAPLLMGGLFLGIESLRRIQALRLIGSAAVILSSAVLVWMAVGVAKGRHKDEIRKGYPSRSAEELLHIAREEKDIFAMNALVMKDKAAAVGPLCEILRDENEDGCLRIAAAQLLGQIGGEQAQAALQDVPTGSRNDYLTEAIGYALDTIRQREEKANP